MEEGKDDLAEPLEMIGNNAKMRDLAIEWTKKGVHDLDEQAKGFRSEERAVFFLTASADLAARMYGEIRKDFEKRYDKPTAKALAQKLLEGTFTATSMLIRRYGEDTQMRVRVDFTEIANPRKDEAEEPTCDHAAAKICNCELDPDGRCAECMSTFRQLFSKLGEATRLIKETNLDGRKFCMPCIPRHMDAALAEIVREEFSKLSGEMAEITIQSLFLASQNVQAMPMPLTKKAWDDLKRGYKT